MNSPRNALVALLCLALLGTSALSWYQYRQLASLRATISDNARITSQANRRISDLESQLSARPRPEAAGVEAPATSDDTQGNRDFRRGRWQARADAFRKVTASPQFQQLEQVRINGQIESRYANLFKALQLPPQALQQFKALLAQKQSAIQDVMASARAEGMFGPQNRAAVQSMIQQTSAQADASIQQSIGDAAYAQYQQYEQTLPQQATVSELAQRLSYTATPLTPDQSQQLVSILSTSTSQQKNTNLDNRAMVAMAMGAPVQPAPVNSSAVQQAQGLLSSDQLAALQQIQNEQQAQHQMQQMMRQAFLGNNATTTPAPTVTSGTTVSNGGN